MLSDLFYTILLTWSLLRANTGGRSRDASTIPHIKLVIHSWEQKNRGTHIFHNSNTLLMERFEVIGYSRRMYVRETTI